MARALRAGSRPLTTGQAARLLGVSPITVRRWIEDGSRLAGAYRTPGGHWRIPRRTVERARARDGVDEAIPGVKRALLFVRVRQGQDQLAGQALTHLIQWAMAQGYAVTKTVLEMGPGVEERRDKLEQVRRAIREGAVDVVVVERRERLLLLGAGEFVRWAGENGVAVEGAGLSSAEAERAYADEILEDIFYPLADALALAVGDTRRAEQAAARALGEIADFLLPREELTGGRVGRNS